MADKKATTAADIHKLIKEKDGFETIGEPQKPVAPPPKPEVAPAPPPKQEVPPAALQVDAVVVEAPRPVYKRWWFWTAAVVVVAAIAAGVTVGVLASSGGKRESSFPDLVAQ